MKKFVNRVVKVALAVMLTTMIAAGAVSALNQPKVTVDSVAILKSQGVTCGSCAGKIEKALKEKPGVASVAVDIETGQVTVGYDSKDAQPEKLAETVTSLGYGSSILQVMSAEQYKATTGKDAPVQTAKSGGCGCCNKKRN